ncbi:patched family domain-containing protein [Ditylenchus destructor]|uniref:Patched family domain-containing protein n=1 Tax=Ditylenchus destructor TaxID=166010 RepID=A0AAD4N485_9BILA|nr:patched family domain-containing protein [Ditylenchus destructor]
MRRLEKAFDIYGRFVARYPFPFLLVPCLLTLISIFGCLPRNFHSQDDIWDIYAPRNALSRVEEKALESFNDYISSNHYRIQVLVDRKDGKNLMNPEDLAEITAVNRLIVENDTISVKGVNKYWSYKDLCGAYCTEGNDPVLTFIQTVLRSRNDPPDNLWFTYPNAQAWHQKIFIGYSVGDFTLAKKNDVDQVDEFRLFILHYVIDMGPLKGEVRVRDSFEAQILRLFNQATIESANLNYALLSRNRELEEQRKITTTAIPYLGLTGLVLAIFMVATLFNRPFYKSQHIEAIFGIISPAMALVTTFGLLWSLGFPFSNILTVVPFLVITIGVDDAFLILAGWRHSNPKADLETRMGESLAKSGASVSVTSVTDVLCFGVGIISNLPVVQLFCLYASVALAIDFIYQITFFVAVCTYCGKRKILHAIMPLSNGKVAPENEIHAAEGDNQDRAQNFEAAFVNFLCNPWTKATTLGLFAAHITVSVYCCSLVNTNFDMENLYLKDSPLTPISQKMQTFVLGESFVVNFVLNNMGSFENVTKRDRFEKMIRELESIPVFSAGNSASTNLWTRDYEIAASWAAEEDNLWEPAELLRNYRAFKLGEKYIRTKLNDKHEEVIDSFTWHISYHNMHNFIDVEELLEVRRKILAKYADTFDVKSHHTLEKVPTESAASAPINFLQTAVSAVILMSVLVFCFIAKFEAIFTVVLSIFSISLGTVGYLHLWSVNLDAVSLISMLMSIGFSVDYSAHVCYHFYTFSSDSETEPKMPVSPPSPSACSTTTDTDSNNSTTVEGSSLSSQLSKSQNDPIHDTRYLLTHTLNGVGWPVIQSGVSTVLGMIPLFFVNAYVVAVFWKTIILVTILGIIHALFICPTFFILLSDLRFCYQIPSEHKHPSSKRMDWCFCNKNSHRADQNKLDVEHYG